MKKKLQTLYLAMLLSPFCVFSQIYVSPNGSASNPGTLSSPTTLENAITQVASGQTIFMRGGSYFRSATILIARTNTGSANSLKRIEAYNGEIPIIDFASQALADSNRGIVLDGSYWYFKGITIQNAGDNGMLLSGNNNTIDNCIFKKNRDSGLQLSRYNTAFTTISNWPSNNLILNCEALDNKDAASENADGFAAKLTCGNGNIFRGCISHNNSDDGWDLYTKTDTGPIGIILFENCVAYNNGTLTDGTTSANGDKNGFKLGGSGISVNHIVRRCVAFGNGHHGFTDNNNLGSIEMSNNTSVNNADANYSFREGGTHQFRNNLSYNCPNSDKKTGTDVGNSNVWWINDVSTNGKGLVVSSADFVSLSVPSNIKNTDGSPNLGNFVALAAGSDLINTGVTATGITFNGSAPDVGAIEYGGTTVTNYTLTTTANPTAGGTISRSPNATTYAAGTVVTLTATPASGYTFTSWSNGATTATTTVTINANTTLTANFTATSSNTYTLTTTASPTAGGSVSRSPNAATYAAGTVVTLTATPVSGYTFTSWSNGATTASTTVTINANTTLTANFTSSSSTTYTLTTSSSPIAGGSISRSPNAATYASGTVVTLTATPASGYTFTSWSNGATTATTTATITANTTLTATFTAITSGSSTLRIDDSTTTTNGYCGADGSRQNSYTGADGGYYINLSNSSAKGVNYAVNVPQSGTYTIKFRYSNGGSSSATVAKVLVNGTNAIASLSFPKTTNWNTWNTTSSATISLAGGVNTIRLETTVNSEFAIIDWLEVTGNLPSTASCSSSGTSTSRMIASENTSEAIDNRYLDATISPNPVESIINLVVNSTKNKKANIALIRFDGQRVSSKSIVLNAGQNTINVNDSNLSSGIYFVTIEAEGIQKTIKAIVK
ncbi:InlB B-repeat-containing protein [Flavobacterium pectinovorum]|uniref:InlB B-repeat-containing protein n=1 Tax=Flavobacterium pectinovorum TaxID=29533 RepID=UPI001FACF340|nr:right-handed parallel beta-helix repeat-containing protein [Flavobacterium pectinovorum]MCI9843526.1 right-handed parallel beta-helix repeat-containing protein [Flavobacterium pectinovorum]